jgi:hypothetical protein
LNKSKLTRFVVQKTNRTVRNGNTVFQCTRKSLTFLVLALILALTIQAPAFASAQMAVAEDQFEDSGGWPTLDSMCDYILGIIEDPDCDFVCKDYHFKWFTGLGCAL